MIEQTIFENNEELIIYVKNNYDLDVTKVTKIDRGSANIYSLNNEYILKEFQSKYSKEEIEKEIAVINHLISFGIKVPEYIKTKRNTFDDVYKDKTIIIQKYIAGDTLENNKGTYEQTIECAEYYGRIVDALKTLPIELPDSDLSSWYSKESFEGSIKKHEDLLSMLDENNEIDKRIREDILEKIEMIKEVESYDFSQMKNLTVLNTHGDYNVSQFIYKDGKINAVIDFVSACKMPVVWELIRSYSYIDKDAINGNFNLDTFVEYVKTFNKYIKLNEYDIKYMPYIYLVQILNSNFGYKQYLYNRDNRKLLDFGFFRTNLCRYLFKNANIIFERLNKEL
nr:phosphotransferase [Bacilli bacterium]